MGYLPIPLHPRWDEQHRVRVHPAVRDQGEEISAWCEGALAGRWSHSTRRETFYFDNITDAILFRLRWGGPPDHDISLIGAAA